MAVPEAPEPACRLRASKVACGCFGYKRALGSGATQINPTLFSSFFSSSLVQLRQGAGANLKGGIVAAEADDVRSFQQKTAGHLPGDAGDGSNARCQFPKE